MENENESNGCRQSEDCELAVLGLALTAITLTAIGMWCLAGLIEKIVN